MSGFPSGVVPAFERDHPDIRIIYGAKTLPYELQDWIAGTSPLQSGADLTLALRDLNWNQTVLFPGTMSPWTSNGRILAVPWSETPWGIRWRADAFEAAALPAPDPNWTWDGFQTACSVLQGVASSGRLKGLRAALGPMAPSPDNNWIQGPQGMAYAPALSLEGLWQSFVWGFGGSVASAQRFTLTGTRTIQGLQTLVDLIRHFTVPTADVANLVTKGMTASDWYQEVLATFAMSFDLYSPEPGPFTSPPWAWARLPRFPVQPVIPILSNALALNASSGKVPDPNARETAAAATFAVWLNSPAAIQLTAPAGIVPANAAPSVQTGFWMGRGPRNAAVVGDWANFRDAYDTFPIVPSRDFVVAALADTLSHNLTLADAVAQAEQQMNAEWAG